MNGVLDSYFRNDKAVLQRSQCPGCLLLAGSFAATANWRILTNFIDWRQTSSLWYISVLNLRSFLSKESFLYSGLKRYCHPECLMSLCFCFRAGSLPSKPPHDRWTRKLMTQEVIQVSLRSTLDNDGFFIYEKHFPAH